MSNETKWTPGLRAAEKLQSLGIAVTQETRLLARLIDEETAAPKLYEALETLVHSYGHTDYTSEEERLSDPDVKAAMVILAKARGETP